MILGIVALKVGELSYIYFIEIPKLAQEKAEKEKEAEGPKESLIKEPKKPDALLIV